MIKGMLVGILVTVAVVAITWGLSKWAVLSNKVEREYGELVGFLFGFGPFILVFVASFAVMGHLEGW